MIKNKNNFTNITIKELAALINEIFKKYSLDCILVGGACVNIYSENQYLSYDLDYVTYESIDNISKALKELNFEKKGKYFINKTCPFFIEFVTPPVAIGNEIIKKFSSIKTKIGEIKLLTPTDSVKDRLASFYFWNDWQSLDQAIMICRKEKVKLTEIKKWSIKEKMLDKFNEFIKQLKTRNNKK